MIKLHSNTIFLSNIKGLLTSSIYHLLVFINISLVSKYCLFVSPLSQIFLALMHFKVWICFMDFFSIILIIYIHYAMCFKIVFGSTDAVIGDQINSLPNPLTKGSIFFASSDVIMCKGTLFFRPYSYNACMYSISCSF